MMLPSLICSSLLLAALSACAQLQGSTVVGTIEASGMASHARTGQRDWGEIVVWLQPVSGLPTPPVAPEHVRLLQKNKMFHPHVLAIRAGTIVDFPNADSIFHNAFSNYDGQLFDIALYPPGTSRSVRFRRPGVVRIFCNIHPSMSAVIVVLNTPYFSNAHADGRYEIASVPAGRYDLHVFDERAKGEVQAQVVVPAEEKNTRISAPLIRLSETGYVQSTHKNKFGLDYPPNSDETGYGAQLK